MKLLKIEEIDIIYNNVRKKTPMELFGNLLLRSNFPSHWVSTALKKALQKW